MSDLRARFIEDYAGGLLNVSRQEFSTSGEVASQDGLPTDGKTLFVEDGTGTKSGLKLGASLAESVDPTTEAGVVNVRFADRTYAKLRDFKLFTTAVASAQAALSEASATSITNLELTLQLLETDISSLQQSIQTDVYDTRNKLEDTLTTLDSLSSKVGQIEKTVSDSTGSTDEISASLSALNSEFQTFKQTTITSITDINSRLNGIDSSLTAVDTRLDTLEEYKTTSQAGINALGIQLQALNVRVTALEGG